MSTIMGQKAITARIVGETYGGKKNYQIAFTTPVEGITQKQYDSFIKFCNDYGNDMFNPRLGFKVAIDGKEIFSLQKLEDSMKNLINFEKNSGIDGEIIIGTPTKTE